MRGGSYMARREIRPHAPLSTCVLSGMRQRSRLVAPARQISKNQCQQPRDALFRWRPVADVFARERLLLEVGAHVAGIDPVHAQIRPLGGEDVREMFERGFAGAVAAPARI